MRWKSYRHRFLPWILLNWKKQFREPCHIDAPQAIADPDSLKEQLWSYLERLDSQLQIKLNDRTTAPAVHLAASFDKQTMNMCHVGLDCALKTLGFTIQRIPSKIQNAGNGVVVTRGSVAENHLVCIYPGLIYETSEPILLQSIANQFVFRCHDGVLLDGNDRGISKVLFRSCAGRDIAGSHLMCDISWLTPHSINALNIGQYVNNHNSDNPANVEYQEIELDEEFPDEFLKYIPNIHYSSSHQFGCRRTRRMVVLRSLRPIKTGEELFSTYFTVTR